jgi:hypothetical protein
MITVWTGRIARKARTSASCSTVRGRVVKEQASTGKPGGAVDLTVAVCGNMSLLLIESDVDESVGCNIGLLVKNQ